MTKSFSIAILSCLAGAATAQGLIIEDESKVAFNQVQEAFEGLSFQRSFSFTIDVTESAGITSKRYGFVRGAIIIDTLQQRDFLKFELEEYSGSIVQPKYLLRRLVADGNRFYIYHPSANSYSVATYSGEQRRLQFFQLLDKATAQGPSSLVGRLVNQVYGGDYPRFTNWIPGSRAQPAGRRESNIHFILNNRQGGERSVAFHSPLVRVMYMDRLGENVVSSPYTSWNLALNWNKGWLGNFSFKPPMNAKQIDGK